MLFFFKDLETKGGIVSKFKSHFDAVEQELKTSTIGKNKVILQTEAKTCKQTQSKAIQEKVNLEICKAFRVKNLIVYQVKPSTERQYNINEHQQNHIYSICSHLIECNRSFLYHC